MWMFVKDCNKFVNLTLCSGVNSVIPQEFQFPQQNCKCGACFSRDLHFKIYRNGVPPCTQWCPDTQVTSSKHTRIICKMRSHKKTKESGFFEGDSSDTDGGLNMGKRTCTTSSDCPKKIKYKDEELDAYIGTPIHRNKGEEAALCAAPLMQRFKDVLFKRVHRSVHLKVQSPLLDILLLILCKHWSLIIPFWRIISTDFPLYVVVFSIFGEIQSRHCKPVNMLFVS